MNAMFPKLFERGKIGQVELENRIVKDGTSNGMQGPDNEVTERMIRFYEEEALGGASLIVVNPIGSGHGPGLTFLSKLIHDNGAKCALQLHTRTASLNESTVEEIRKIVNAVGDEAALGQKADFDMVWLHACHGDLIHSFLSPARNRRMDPQLGHQYGGSLHHRMKFLVDIVKDIKKKTGADFPLIVKLSAIDYEPGGVELEQTLEVVKVLEGIGVDAIDVSAGTHGAESHGCPCMLIPVAPNVPAAEAIKKVVHIPVMAVGAITTPQLAEEILESGKADFISLARPLLADPYWPKKAREGRPEDIRPCIRCNYGCNDKGPPFHSLRCTTNPALGWEDRAITPAERVKNVAVIGGGPGGMEAAMVCALRGHKVTLYEKRKLGGALIEASVPEFKSEIRRLTSYYVTQLEKLKVRVIKKEATAETLKDGKFDAVTVAVGAALKKPDVPGINKPIVTDVLAVLNGKAKVGQRVLIVGGGMVGVEVGIWLAEQGKEVIFIEMLAELMSDVGEKNRATYQDRLAKQKKLTIYTGRTLYSVLDKGAIVVDRSGNRQKILADSIVLAMGFLPQTTLRDQLDKETGLEVYAIGNCVSPRRIYDAIHEGFATARKI